MNLDLKSIIPAACGNALLTTQIMFSVGYVGSCELVNLFGTRSLGVCEARWSTVLALWCPSGLQGGAGVVAAAGAALGDKRKRLFGG
jgi:hypothetical protein